MEDQAASLRRLTPSAQVGRSFAFLGVSGCGTTTVVAEMAAGLVAAQRRVLILDAHPGNPLAQRFVDDPGILFLLERNGVNLQYSNKPAEALADIYAEAVVRRCSASQWQMNADEHAMLLTWLGASAVPAAAAMPEIQA